MSESAGQRKDGAGVAPEGYASCCDDAPPAEALSALVEVARAALVRRPAAFAGSGAVGFVRGHS